MKHAAFLAGVLLLFAVSAGAQADSASSPLLASSDPGASGIALASFSPVALTPGALSAVAARGGDALSANSGALSEPAAQEPAVYGVFQQYNWQAYAGYTYFRFYLVPNTTLNTNGLNLAIAYYPKGGHVAGDGEFVGTWGSSQARFGLALGGVRVRWSIPRGMELWGHVMGGGAHFLPQTAYGNQTAWAYEAGGGVDIPMHNHGRFAYRASADMVGTRFFGTNQFSPKLSVGIVFKY